jgi:AraC-like DNA-binding protein
MTEIQQVTASANRAGGAPHAIERQSRIGALQAVPSALSELGVDPCRAFSQLDIDSCLFANPDNLIANAVAGRLLRLCSELTRCQHFGLLVGEKAGLASRRFLGALARHAPDIGSALRATNGYLGLNNTAAVATLSEDGTLAMWSYAIYEPDLEGTDQIHLCASAVGCNVLRQLCGHRWTPQEVLLPCRRPRDAKALRSFYGAPVRFDSDHLSLIFARSWLSHPVRDDRTSQHWTLLQQAIAMEAKIAAALPDLVRRALRRLLLAGKTSIKEVAATLSVHRRTLDRQLDAHGVTFRSLAEEVRYAVSQQLLRDTEMPIRDIAAALHYANQSAFATAFRRWSGMTASEWRNRTWATPSPPRAFASSAA